MNAKLSVETAINDIATVLWESNPVGKITFDEMAWAFTPVPGIHHKRLALIEKSLREFMAGPSPEDSQTQGGEVVSHLAHDQGTEGSIPSPATNDPEPEKSHEAGDKTPAYINWFKRNHTPEEFAAKYSNRKFTL